MNNILQIDPEKLLANSTARLFMIVFSTEKESYFCLPGGTTQSATRIGGIAIEKELVVRAYYDALNELRTASYGDGRLDIIAIPKYEQ